MAYLGLYVLIQAPPEGHVHELHPVAYPQDRPACLDYLMKKANLKIGLSPVRLHAFVEPCLAIKGGVYVSSSGQKQPVYKSRITGELRPKGRDQNGQPPRL